MNEEYKTRKRVNYSQSVKGVVTVDCTVEGIDMTNEELIIESTKLLDLALIVAKERSTN